MATYTEETNYRIVDDGFLSSETRYNNSKILIYGDDRRLTISTYKKHNFEFSENDKYFVVTPKHEYRPDLTSQQVYFTPGLWWILLEANNIKDIFDYKTGLNIRIPETNLSISFLGE